MTTKRKTIIKPRRPSGFQEYLPQNQIVMNHMLDKIRQSYELFGFTPIETPAVEFTEILKANVGNETQKQIYRLDKTGDDLSLHFDLTVPLARYVAQNFHNLVFPFRRYQIQKVWRGERSQKGRFREFYQCDVDVIGSSNLLADAEIPSVISYVFSSLKFGNFTVRINNRKILSGLLEDLDISRHTNSVLRAIDKIEKHGYEETVRELRKIGISTSKIKVIQKLLEISGSNKQIISQLLSFKVKSPIFKTGVEELAFVVKHAILFGISNESLKIDLTIVRGLDYYTGTVYETILNDYPEVGSVCSGGRYDDLVSKFSNVNLSGVGVSIGLSRLFYQLQEAGILKGSQITPSKVLVIQIGDKVLEYCIRIVTELRKNGINSEIYLESEKMKKSMRYANRLKVPYAIIVGEKEVANNSVTLKMMKTGNQFKLSLMESIQVIKEK